MTFWDLSNVMWRLSRRTSNWRYCWLLEHFCLLKIGRDKQEKKQSLQKCFKKKIDKIKGANDLLSEYLCNFKSHWHPVHLNSFNDLFYIIHLTTLGWFCHKYCSSDSIWFLTGSIYFDPMQYFLYWYKLSWTGTI